MVTSRRQMLGNTMLNSADETIGSPEAILQ